MVHGIHKLVPRATSYKYDPTHTAAYIVVHEYPHWVLDIVQLNTRHTHVLFLLKRHLILPASCTVQLSGCGLLLQYVMGKHMATVLNPCSCIHGVACKCSEAGPGQKGPLHGERVVSKLNDFPLGRR